MRRTAAASLQSRARRMWGRSGGPFARRPSTRVRQGPRWARTGPYSTSLFSIGSIASVLSILSLRSAGSILSIGSIGSVLSIGSAGSILSIGSAGSILCIGSAGGVLRIGGRRVTLDHQQLAGPDMPSAEAALAAPTVGTSS